MGMRKLILCQIEFVDLILVSFSDVKQLLQEYLHKMGKLGSPTCKSAQRTMMMSIICSLCADVSLRAEDCSAVSWVYLLWIPFRSNALRRVFEEQSQNTVLHVKNNEGCLIHF